MDQSLDISGTATADFHRFDSSVLILSASAEPLLAFYGDRINNFPLQMDLLCRIIPPKCIFRPCAPLRSEWCPTSLGMVPRFARNGAPLRSDSVPQFAQNAQPKLQIKMQYPRGYRIPTPFINTYPQLIAFLILAYFFHCVLKMQDGRCSQKQEICRESTNFGTSKSLDAVSLACVAVAHFYITSTFIKP